MTTETGKPPSGRSNNHNLPSNHPVMIVDQKPNFDSQVSALSDRDGIGGGCSSLPTTPVVAVPCKVFQELPAGATNIPVPASSPSGSETASVKTSITFSGQADLAPLPIPPLEETLQKFLRSIKALDDDPLQSERIVMDFLHNEGPRLQKLLLEYDRVGRETGTIGSYVEEFWNDSYLAPDSSVVLNLNPFFVLEDSPDPKIATHPIKRAASLCFASVKLASQLRSEALRPDTFKGRPLCMDQFKCLFSTARIPNKNDKDAINVYEKSNHLAVLCRGNIYYFQVLWPDGHVAVDEADIVDILQAIHDHAVEEVGSSKDPLKSQRSIAVLTSLPRKEWAAARETLIQHSPKNEESLKIIDSSLFVLVLDDYIPKDKHDAAANMLHGSYLLEQYNLDQDSVGGRSASSVSEEGRSDWLVFSDYQAGSCCNRWYDKMQIIVCGNGTAGINFEHSAIDGHTALRFVSDVYAETVISFAQSITKLVAAHGIIPNVISATVRRAATALDSGGRATLDVFPKKIHFDLPESIHRKIYYAETALGDEIFSSETYVLEFKDYGKSFITGNKLSPDSYVQMSMMLAYYKLYGRIVCAYEPVLTKNFFHGRTEAMRPATVEAKKLCETFSDPKASREDKLTALQLATKIHSAHVKECTQGKGVDRHLFALKCIAEKNGVPVPSFYNSRPWKMLNHTTLSTSNCGNPALAGFGFGPVVPDGLGIGYIIKDHQLHYSISSKHRQTRRYAYTLESVLREMASLFNDTKKDSLGASLRADAVAQRQRQRLKHIPLHMISYDSYGDIWGEESAPAPARSPSPTQSPPVPPKQRWSAILEAQDDEHEAEEVFLKLRDQPKKVDQSASADGGLPDADGTPTSQLKRRGSKDSIPVQPARGRSVAELNWDNSDRSHPQPQLQQVSADLNKIEEDRPAKIKRNRSRNVGVVNRVATIDYKELSQKGIQIEMDRSKRAGQQGRHQTPTREASFNVHDLADKRKDEDNE